MNPALAHPSFIALKACLAALLALALVNSLHVPDTLSATFVACACLTPTVYSGFRRGLEQIGASAVGGVLTWLLELWFPPTVALGLGLLLSIWLCFRIGLGEGFLIASFTVLYVTLLSGSTPGLTLVSRMESVGLGALSAFAVTWRCR